MSDSDAQETERIVRLIGQLNRTWMEGRPEDLEAFLHGDVVMVFPGFSGQSVGRDAMIAGFKQFCESARLHEYIQSDVQISVVGTTAVVGYEFEMTYEREARNYRATGRDLWVFSKVGQRWLAVWRTMLEMKEEDAG